MITHMHEGERHSSEQALEEETLSGQAEAADKVSSDLNYLLLRVPWAKRSKITCKGAVGVGCMGSTWDQKQSSGLRAERVRVMPDQDGKQAGLGPGGAYRPW